MSEAGTLSKWRLWMRDLSEHLLVSYRSSALIAHSVTVGESREQQVLDVLQLLPNSLELVKNINFIDATGKEAQKFDGALVNRTNLPLLYSDNSTSVAMVEAAAICLETKSNLNRNELRDIFDKSQTLSNLAWGLDTPRPLVAAFAYQCDNLNLAFFHYAASFWSEPTSAPFPICVLNQAVFMALSEGAQPRLLHRGDTPNEPVWLRSEEDSLLTFLYLVLRLLDQEEKWITLARAYSPDFLEVGAKGYRFPGPFKSLVSGGGTAVQSVRRLFQRHSHDSIADIVQRALSSA
jgi:hypothetical protein